MSHNERVVSDIILGKRVAFYELRGEIGTGNFSQVKLGVHALTKGENCGIVEFYTIKRVTPEIVEKSVHSNSVYKGLDLFSHS